MKTVKLLSAIPLALAANSLHADILDIEITNLTHAIHFTPLLISAHNNGISLFKPGEMAGVELQAMAEGGNIAPLSEMVAGFGANNSLNPAEGLLAPASSTSIMMFDTGNNDHLSIVAMLLPTNDGFVGLNDWQIPDTAGSYTLYLSAYDAGTEANDEIVNGGGAPGTPGIPAIPGEDAASTATGVTSTEQNHTVHIHRGNVGDADSEGGKSDLDSRVHRWLNPVAKVVVTVK